MAKPCVLDPRSRIPDRLIRSGRFVSELPPPSRLVAALKWVIPLVVLAAFYKGYLDHAGEGLRRMLFAWILPNSVAAAVGGIIAGAKPLTVLVGLVASPITSLKPTIGAGMVAGLVEAWLRKPTVADCEHTITVARSSRTGKYCSLHVELVVTDEDHRNGVFRALRDHEDVKFVL